MEPVAKCVKELGRRGVKPYRIFVYCLIQDVDDALERINALRKLGVLPFAQPYRDFDNNVEPTNEQKRLARWCNHRAIFKSVEFKTIKDDKSSNKHRAVEAAAGTGRSGRKGKYGVGTM